MGVGGTISGNDFIVPYGVMIISKYPCLFYEKYFKSKMGRSVLFAEPILPINLIVATSHFESFGASAYLRKGQMTETFWLLEFAQKAELANHSVIAGDFNFDKSDKIEECVITSSGYRDVM